MKIKMSGFFPTQKINGSIKRLHFICLQACFCLSLRQVALLPLTGTTEEHIRGCLAQETKWTVILYSQHSNVLRCSDNQMTEKYQGYIKPCFTSVIVQLYLRFCSHCSLKSDSCPNWIVSGLEEMSFHVMTTAQMQLSQGL